MEDFNKKQTNKIRHDSKQANKQTNMKTNKHAKFLSHLSPKRGRPTLGWTRPSPEVSGDDPPPFEWWDWCPLDEVPPFLFKRPNPWETLVVGMCRDPRHPCHLEKANSEVSIALNVIWEQLPESLMSILLIGVLIVQFSIESAPGLWKDQRNIRRSESRPSVF